MLIDKYSTAKITYL